MKHRIYRKKNSSTIWTSITSVRCNVIRLPINELETYAFDIIRSNWKWIYNSIGSVNVWWSGIRIGFGCRQRLFVGHRGIQNTSFKWRHFHVTMIMMMHRLTYNLCLHRISFGFFYFSFWMFAFWIRTSDLHFFLSSCLCHESIRMAMNSEINQKIEWMVHDQFRLYLMLRK